jgi:hypothetical protein
VLPGGQEIRRLAGCRFREGLRSLLEEHWRNISRERNVNYFRQLRRSDAGSIPAAALRSEATRRPCGFFRPSTLGTHHFQMLIRPGHEVKKTIGRSALTRIRRETHGPLSPPRLPLIQASHRDRRIYLAATTPSEGPPPPPRFLGVLQLAWMGSIDRGRIVCRGAVLGAVSCSRVWRLKDPVLVVFPGIHTPGPRHLRAPGKQARRPVAVTWLSNGGQATSTGDGAIR